MDHDTVKNRLKIALGTLMLIDCGGDEVIERHINDAADAIKKAHSEVEHDEKLRS